MFGRAVLVAAFSVAVALIASFSLSERLRRPRPSPAPAASESFGYREAVLEADGRGQYAADALVNGLRLRMLVDTGASDVVTGVLSNALSAVALGLLPRGSSPRVAMTTARQFDPKTALVCGRP